MLVADWLVVLGLVNGLTSHVVWLVNRLVHYYTGRYMDWWLVNGFMYGLVYGFVNRLVYRLMSRLVNGLMDRFVNWFMHRFVDRFMNGFINRFLVNRFKDRLRMQYIFYDLKRFVDEMGDVVQNRRSSLGNRDHQGLALSDMESSESVTRPVAGKVDAPRGVYIGEATDHDERLQGSVPIVPRSCPTVRGSTVIGGQADWHVRDRFVDHFLVDRSTVSNMRVAVKNGARVTPSVVHW